jgi:hypothetical protein
MGSAPRSLLHIWPVMRKVALEIRAETRLGLHVKSLIVVRL